MKFSTVSKPLLPKAVPDPLLYRLFKEGLSERAIAKDLQSRGYSISRSTVNRKLRGCQAKVGSTAVVSLKNGEKLTNRSKRWLVRQVIVHKQLSARETVASLQRMGVGVCRQTTYRALASNQYLQAKRPRKGVYITKQHIRSRKQWVQERLKDKIDWSKVLFSDAKLWYLDGPAGRPKLWQDSRLPPVRIPSKGMRNEAVYVWGAFSLSTVPDLSYPPGHYKAEEYCGMLANQLQTHSNLKKYTLYHDRDPAHTAAETQEWLRTHNWKSVHFPAKGADLNPMENLWGIMTRKVFGATKTFTNKHSLRAAIETAWREIQQDRGLRAKLVGSMRQRLVAVALRKGGLTSY